MAVKGSVTAVNKNISGNISSSEAINGNVDKAENIYVKETEFNNRFEFPSIGKDNIIYVAKDEHKTYIFNSETLKYEVVGSDYAEIEIIQGKL